MSEDGQVSTQKISKYNSAELLNLALHALWQETRNACLKGNFSSWNTHLDLIWGELCGDLDEKDKRIADFNKINEQIYKSGRLSNPEIKGFSNNHTDAEAKAKQYILLRNKHVWLKRLQNQIGKGTAYKDEFEDDID